MVKEVLDIGIERTYICPPTILMMMVFITMKVLEYLQVMEGVDLGIKIPANLSIEIVEFIVVLIIVMTIV